MVDPISLGPVRKVRGHFDLPQEDKGLKAIGEAANLGIKRSTSLPKLMSMAAELASQGPPVDSVKIAKIRAAIASGRYEIDPERIANAISNFYGKSRV